MPSVQRTFRVSIPPAEVIDYLKDFANTVEWDPGTQSCTQNGSGPVEVGTTWHNVSKLAGFTTELEYELRELTDRGLVFVGHNQGATTTDTISVLPVGKGSELTYRADIDLHGVSALATPVLKVVLERLGDQTQEQLRNVLDARS